MALTITEQLQLIAGTVKPPSNHLGVLVHQTAVKFAVQFYDTYKSIDPSLTPLGQQYLNKMFGVSDRMFRKSDNVIEQLTRIIVVIIGKQNVTLNQVTAANDELWEGFVFDQMDEAFEYLSGVKRDEKAAYTAALK